MAACRRSTAAVIRSYGTRSHAVVGFHALSIGSLPLGCARVLSWSAHGSPALA